MSSLVILRYRAEKQANSCENLTTLLRRRGVGNYNTCSELCIGNRLKCSCWRECYTGSPNWTIYAISVY